MIKCERCNDRGVYVFGGITKKCPCKTKTLAEELTEPRADTAKAVEPLMPKKRRGRPAKPKD